ncbi:hypothetical protein DSQ37_02860, partial [Ureaplasma urealyticum]
MLPLASFLIMCKNQEAPKTNQEAPKTNQEAPKTNKANVTDAFDTVTYTQHTQPTPSRVEDEGGRTDNERIRRPKTETNEE